MPRNLGHYRLYRYFSENLRTIYSKENKLYAKLRYVVKKCAAFKNDNT